MCDGTLTYVALSVVSDTLDLWKVCTEHVVTLKEEILARDGKLVIRPDSGNPVDIICGHGRTELTEQEKRAGYPEFYTKGLIECLWEIFGRVRAVTFQRQKNGDCIIL